MKNKRRLKKTRINKQKKKQKTTKRTVPKSYTYLRE